MEKKKYRSCKNCRALMNGNCLLGYKTQKTTYPHSGLEPLEPCEKPKTMKNYIQLYGKKY